MPGQDTSRAKGLIYCNSINERITIGVGMSASQKLLWLMVSEAAWRQAVFPADFFDNDHVLIPNTRNHRLWALLHGITRHTFMDELIAGEDLGWQYIGGASGRYWQLVSNINGDTIPGFVLRRGNTLVEAHDQLTQRRLRDNDDPEVRALVAESLRFPERRFHTLSVREYVLLKFNAELRQHLPVQFQIEVDRVRARLDEAGVEGVPYSHIYPAGAPVLAWYDPIVVPSIIVPGPPPWTVPHNDSS